MYTKFLSIFVTALLTTHARPTVEGVDGADEEIEGEPVPVRSVKEIEEELARLNVTRQGDGNGGSCIVNMTEQENERKSILLGRNAVTSDRYLWNKKKFPVFLDSKTKFTEVERKIIEMQLSILQEQVFFGGCLNITLYPPGKKPTGIARDYVLVKKLQGCSSESTGRKGGPQYVSLHDTCFWENFDMPVIHEFMHALGLSHEQNRPDRDNYVIINWDNMQDGAGVRHNFNKVDTRIFGTYGVEYNYNSIMHYRGKDFSKNGKSVIVAKDNPMRYVGPMYRGVVPDTDKRKLRQMYKCN